MKLLQSFIVMSVVAVFAATPVVADTAAEIDADVDKALENFRSEVSGAEAFLNNAAGVLVFPRVVKAGVGIGGEYGQGALRMGGKTVDYYSTAAGSFGFQLGAQAKSIVIAFMTKESLEKFRNSAGFKVGVDGSVALIDLGAGKSIDTANIKDPVVGFVFGSKGLMYNLTLEGTKFTKLDK